MSITNKKIVKIHKEPCDENNSYCTINLEAMSKAAHDLDGEAFKQWCYLAATIPHQGESFNDNKEVAPNE